MYAYINDEYKFVIFWSPRCGHGSISELLVKTDIYYTLADIVNFSYNLNKNKKKRNNLKEKIKNYNHFIIYRNPYKRFLSFFKNTALKSNFFDNEYPNRYCNIKNYLIFLKNIKLNLNNWGKDILLLKNEIHHALPIFTVDNDLINENNATYYNIDNNEFKNFVIDFLKIINCNEKSELLNLWLNKNGNKNKPKYNIDYETLELFNEIYKNDLNFIEKNKIKIDIPFNIIN